jgi:hypothetical protein
MKLCMSVMNVQADLSFYDLYIFARSVAQNGGCVDL